MVSASPTVWSKGAGHRSDPVLCLRLPDCGCSVRGMQHVCNACNGQAAATKNSAANVSHMEHTETSVNLVQQSYMPWAVTARNMTFLSFLSVFPDAWAQPRSTHQASCSSLIQLEWRELMHAKHAHVHTGTQDTGPLTPPEAWHHVVQCREWVVPEAVQVERQSKNVVACLAACLSEHGRLITRRWGKCIHAEAYLAARKG